MTERPEGGHAPQRIEWVPETTVGETPTDPAWNPYSDTITSWFDGTPNANTEPLGPGHGGIDPAGFYAGSETHEYSFTYRMQQWFVDGGGNTADPSYDAIDRDTDNWFAGRHSVVAREEHTTDAGSANSGRRIYAVGQGGHPTGCTVPFETEDGLPIELTLNYQFEKVRTYSISQPAASTTVWVQSTDASDTTQTLTVEDEGAATTEGVSLNGTTAVETTASFADIDAAELDAETTGDVEVYDGDPGVSGTLLLTIPGEAQYDNGEGDLGVPALGSGSHASALGSDYVVFNDDSITYAGALSNAEIISGELEVTQNATDNTQTGTQRRSISPQNRQTMFRVSFAGKKVTVDMMTEHLQANATDVVWTADEGTVTGPNAVVMDPGSIGKEAGEAKTQLDVELESEGITIT